MALITDFSGAAGTTLTGPGAGTNLVLAAGADAAGKLTGTGAAYLANTGTAARQIYLSPETPASADYDAETTRVAPSFGFDTRHVVGVRYSTDGLNGYELEHNIDDAAVRLYRVVDGARSAVLLGFSGYWNTIRLAVSGTGATVTLTVHLDGVAQTPYSDTDSSRITATGRPGCGWVGAASATNTATGGINIDSFSSSAYSGAPANTAPAVTITSPTAAALAVPAGTKLVVEGTAMDSESGSLSTSIVWSSSDTGDGNGGVLGTGAGLTLDTTGWTPGGRTISAGVTDAGGLTAAPDTFSLTIGAGGSTLILEDDVQQEILQGGVAATVRVALRDASGAVLESNPLAPGDVKKSVDGGAAAVLAGDAGAAAWTVVNGFLNVPLTAAEVTGGEITLFIEDQDGSAYLDRAVKIMVVGYDPRATPASTTQIAGAVGDALSARLAS